MLFVLHFVNLVVRKDENRMNSLTLRARLVSLVPLLVVFYSIWDMTPGAALAASSTANVRKQAAYVQAPDDTAVLTFKNDIGRTGSNNHETILTKENVNANKFGRRATFPVVGQVDAQPLFVPNLTIDGAPHNVVFVATEHDNVYAFDAEGATGDQPLWHMSLLNAGEDTLKADQLSCPDLQPESGITGTPVIDKNANTMYVVSYSNTTPGGNPTPIYRLHALDLTTGKDKSDPTVITGEAKGQNGAFNPLRERQRAGLLLTNGQVYVPFAAFCDNPPYDGRIYSYSYNGTTFQQNNIYNAAPNAGKSGLWGGGGALAADENGNIYSVTGNGDFNLNTGGADSGDSFIKLNGNLQRQDYFTPFQESCLNKQDIDLGSGGPLIIPGQNKLISAGKEGRIYNLDTNNMGQYTEDPKLIDLLKNPLFADGCNTDKDQTLESAIEAELRRVDVDKVFQETAPNVAGFGLYSTACYWKSDDGEHVYFIGNSDKVKAFSLNAGKLSDAPTSQSNDVFGTLTGNSVISSNGTATASGILWAEDRATNALRAYDASNLATKLYDSADDQNKDRDRLGTVQKFAAPTVANGRVFVGTADSLVIYGLDPTAQNSNATENANPPFNNVGITNDTDPGAGAFDNEKNSYSAQELARVGALPGDNFNYKAKDGNTFLFTFPGGPGQPNDYVANGQIITIPVTPTTQNAKILGILGASADGEGSGVFTITYTDGTSQQEKVGLSDWSNPTPDFGNEVAIMTNYRNPAGPEEGVKTFMFFASVPIDGTKTLKSVSLPTNLDAPTTLHVFSVSASIRAQ